MINKGRDKIVFYWDLGIVIRLTLTGEFGIMHVIID